MKELLSMEEILVIGRFETRMNDFTAIGIMRQAGLEVGHRQGGARQKSDRRDLLESFRRLGGDGIGHHRHKSRSQQEQNSQINAAQA